MYIYIEFSKPPYFEAYVSPSETLPGPNPLRPARSLSPKLKNSWTNSFCSQGLSAESLDVRFRGEDAEAVQPLEQFQGYFWVLHE